jgi:hypothetical protein
MLKSIIWNGLYARHPAKRAFVETRINDHYKRFALAKRGLDVADVRYVPP